MIRFKDGKVDRSVSLNPWHSREECVIGGLEAYGALCHDLADALDVAVAALRKIRGDKPTKRDEKDEEIADDALHQIGVDQ